MESIAACRDVFTTVRHVACMTDRNRHEHPTIDVDICRRSFT